MKQCILLATFICFLLLGMAIPISCSKGAVSATETPNWAPIAMAGPDIQVLLANCSDSNGIAELDGSSSVDYNKDIQSYRWTKIYGPEGITFSDSLTAKARLERLSIGEYGFLLTVIDSRKLFSVDTVTIRVVGPGKEYDVDFSFNAPVTFQDDVEINYSKQFQDIIRVSGTGNFPPLGDIEFFLSENSDTVNHSKVVRDRHVILRYNSNSPKILLKGECNINFKLLYLKGGGSFSGILKVTGGEAENCSPDVFKNLAPLEFTGTLNASTREASIRIRGKAYI